MALELRPSCEHCDRDLPPHSREAMICSFECTFCRNCAQDLLGNVCPNCGGGFEARSIRPAHNHKGDNYLGAYPASQARKLRPVNLAKHQALATRLQSIMPADR